MTEQKAETQLGAMAGDAGACCCPRQPPQPSATAVTLGAALCGIDMAIGIAATATACPRIPKPKATSRVRTRSRAMRPWLMDPQISPVPASFKATAHGASRFHGHRLVNKERGLVAARLAIAAVYLAG